jgi:hypothetical protein
VANVLVAAAFVPSAPVLVPELSGPTVPEVLPVRAAAVQACRDLAEMCSRWVLVGIGDLSRPVSPRGSFVGFGVDVQVDLTPGADGPADPEMPTAVLLGAWLRGQTDPSATLTVELADARAPSIACIRQGRNLGSRLATIDEPVGLLVVADGATTLTAKAPGGLAPGAVECQAQIDSALGAADLAVISGLDETRCADLGVGGRAAWQVVAGTVGALEKSRVHPESRYAGAPFGVGYTVAWWGL